MTILYGTIYRLELRTLEKGFFRESVVAHSECFVIAQYDHSSRLILFVECDENGEGVDSEFDAAMFLDPKKLRKVHSGHWFEPHSYHGKHVYQAKLHEVQ